MRLIKLPPITDEEYALCNQLNRELVEDFLVNSTQLSDKTLFAYRSSLRIWLKWIKDNLNNKNVTEIKPREYLRFQNWLVNRGCSSSDIRTKRSTISSLNNYIEVYYLDEYPMFRNCVNSSIPVPEKSYVHEKNPPTRKEIMMLCDEVEKSNRWNKYMIIAFIKFAFETGCRRGELLQIQKDIINAEKIVKEVEVRNEDGSVEKKTAEYYQTPKIRCKGRGKTGKIRQLKFSDYSMDAFKKWMEVRGEDNVNEMFITKDHGNYVPATPATLNDICMDILTPILGRRIYPHAFRSASATVRVVEDGKSIEVVRSLLGHNSAETTKIYVCGIDDEAEADELFT